MPDMTMPCSCCGNLLTIPENASTLPCPACGTQNARPRSTGDTLTTLERATRQRLACDFAAAETSYQQVLLVNPDEHEALWGRLMCHYGVEYVEDAASGKRLPTVHTVRPRPLRAQPDFTAACEFAPEAVRSQYEQDAAYIDDAQEKIRQLNANQPGYDVFLCHKTTLTGGGYTQEFRYATQLYHFLQGQGLRVFFAPESLSSVAAGSSYEAGIYHALHTARAMLVVCSDPENLLSPWVQSEWSRFLDLADADAGKRLIPLLYGGMSPSQLPAPFRFRKLQAIDMADIGATDSLMSLLNAFLAAPTEEAPAEKAAAVKAPAVATGEIAIEFPRRIPEWKVAPKWKICLNDKKNTVLTPIKWGGKNTLIPLAEEVSVTVREDRVSRWWPLLLPLYTFAAFLLGGYATFFIAFLGCLVTGPAFAVWYIRRIIRHYRKVLTFTLTPGKRYRLYWDDKDQLQVDAI